jgi:uncharacterized membrane protein YhhN
VAVVAKNKRLEYAATPGTMVALVAVALTIDAVDAGSRKWFLVALAFSLLGDVALMFDRFVPGLVAFLLAHIAYTGGFIAEDVSVLGVALGAAVLVLVGTLVGGRILSSVRNGRDPGLTGPVAAYMVVISTMVAVAIGTGEALAIAGAVLFYCSDSLIGWNRFRRPLGWAPLAIMVTYHVAQAFLVLSLTV